MNQRDKSINNFCENINKCREELKGLKWYKFKKRRLIRQSIKTYQNAILLLMKHKRYEHRNN